MDSKDYKSTILLPQTAFPMKADLPVREPKFLERWNIEGIYEKIIARRKEQAGDDASKRFVLHDGPPFANGDAHIGHLLNMTLKDLVLKSRNMFGFYAPFVPGWDCHGLPIEHKVMQDKGKAGEDMSDPVAIRKECQATARKFIGIQREQFKRLGVFGEWETPYITMDPAYEADILRVFAKLVEKDLVYNDLRPVRWSTGCQTALAEAELEYDENRVDPSAYVKFPITDASTIFKLEQLTDSRVPAMKKVNALIWTTTPWTLPANLAVAMSPTLDYALYESAEPFGYILCAVDLVSKLPRNDKHFFIDHTPKMVGKSFKGSEFATPVSEAAAHKDKPVENFRQPHAEHPFLNRTSPFYAADFVTAETGTGLVHIAPGHGQDDYQLGKAVGLRLLSPVDDRGCLTEECGVPELVGQYVFKANAPILELLDSKDLLFAREDYKHKYPLCWRSKTPIIFRAVKQWFIKMDFRHDALEAIGEVKWVPTWGENRIRGAVETRPDWCISRQRTWGVPIPVFYGEGGQPLMNADTIRKFADIVETEGTDVWFATPDEEMARRLGLYAASRKGRDTLDVWIDSGSSHAAVAKRRGWWPADLYLEGSDQHRGWFQSSLSLSVATTAGTP
ncbi:MAG TPA: isoleucine--tRNA ligase, partial [Candidatus Methylacidiphilales bacterium]|nr:isoleucine--tRNA ligase [Candidatus Methylacidiphilales bacterium]